MLPLPLVLQDIPEDTAIVGNIDLFIEYVETGHALKDWNFLLNKRFYELEEWCNTPLEVTSDEEDMDNIQGLE